MNNIFILLETRLFHPCFIQGCCCTGRAGKGLHVAQLADGLAAPSLLLCFLLFYKHCAQFVFSTSRFLVREEDIGFALSLIPICWNLTKICGGGGGFLFPGAEERRGWGRESQSVGGLRELRCVRPSVRVEPWGIYYHGAPTGSIMMLLLLPLTEGGVHEHHRHLCSVS